MDSRDTGRPLIAVDSNAIVGLLNPQDTLNQTARRALSSARKRGDLTICGFVYVELSATPAPAGWTVDYFLATTGIHVDWNFEETIWRQAAEASHFWYRQKRGGAAFPRRVAADVLIGAHALHRGAELLTFDGRTFQTAFPKLKVVTA